jgi:flagellar basal body rod protein FlgG
MGPEALQRAARAFRYWEHRQQAVSHNLANASTPGFKGERVFARLLRDGGLEARGQTDLRSGSLTETGRPLDLALGGSGFFVVDTPRGERLVRGGSFRLDANRTLVDARGNPLLARGNPRGRPVTLPEGEYEVTPRGEVLVDGSLMATLRVEEPAPGATLEREEGLHFRTGGRTVPVEVESVKVLSGHLEESNVQPVESLVEMIEIQRAYSALQRSVLAMDGVMDRISNDLGKVR